MLHPINKVRIFYTQHVLPLIYDYSLSFYEALCKMAKTLNDTIESVEEISDKTEDLQEQINALDPVNITEQLESIHTDINNINNSITNINNDIEELRTTVIEQGQDLTGIHNTLADHETRISILEGYAFEGITPATKEYVDTHDVILEQTIVNNYITDLQDQIDAISGGGYTPVYGSVDFGKAKLLRYDPTLQNMVVVRDDIQVSAAYVKALNMVYGSFYISFDEDQTLNYIPADTYVLCWKNSQDLPPIAHDFPGIKVQWDDETHAPDTVKFGINYNNKLTKRIDTFFTPNRDQYPGVIGTGYRWYSELYMNDIVIGEEGEDNFQWAPIQIPFCYLSLKSGGLIETDIVNIEEPVTRGSGSSPYELARNPVDLDWLDSSNCAGWGIEFNIHNLTGSSSASSVYRGGFVGLGRMSRQGTIFMKYTDDTTSQITVFGGSGSSSNAVINNKIKAGERMRLVYMYADRTLTLYDGLGDMVAQVDNFDYTPNKNDSYNTTGLLFGYTNDTGGKTLGSYGTIDEFRVFTLK